MMIEAAQESVLFRWWDESMCSLDARQLRMPESLCCLEQEGRMSLYHLDAQRLGTLKSWLFTGLSAQ